MRNREQAHRILEVFTRYGFERTSIVMLAEAMGVARQTVYNRFGGKEEVLTWAIDTLAHALRQEACEHLECSDDSTEAALAKALGAWLAPLVGLRISGPHSYTILGIGTALRRRAEGSTMLASLSSDLARFLQRRQVCADRASANTMTHLMVLAARGAMLTATNESEYRASISKALRGLDLTCKVDPRASAPRIRRTA